MMHSEAYEYSKKFNTVKHNYKKMDEGGELYILGRPCLLPESIDEGQRVSKSLRSKMTLMDLIPCRHSINVQKIKDDQNLSGLIPQIIYEDVVKEFKEDCKSYGLSDKFVGLRIYTTDDTQAADSITNNRNGENYFQGLANKAYQLASPVSNFMASVGLSEERSLGRTGSTIAQGLGDVAGAITSIGGLEQDVQNLVSSTTSSMLERVGDAAFNGYRYSFPTIWSDSTYRPNLSTNLKLISPYGHPTAIRKFIVEPLMYLLLLASPKTKDGMAYGRPYSLTLSAYGMTYVPLGAISSINFRRGGSNTAFTIYRQPLTIDVSIQFEAQVGGFATFKGGQDSNADPQTANNSSEFVVDYGKTMAMSSPTLTTLEHIVHSLRPVPSDAEHHSHVYLGKTKINQGEFGAEERNSKPASPQQLNPKNIRITDLGGEVLKEVERLADGSTLFRQTIRERDVPSIFNASDNNISVQELQTLRAQTKDVVRDIVDSMYSIKDAVTVLNDKRRNIPPMSNIISNEVTGQGLNFGGSNLKLDKGILQRASTNISDYVSERTKLTGTMGIGQNIQKIGSDSIEYVGNMMGISSHYDTNNMATNYNTTGKSSSNDDVDDDFII